VPDDFVASLIADLRRRLDEIEAERGAIGRALRGLEGRKARRPRRELRAALVEGIGASPGLRASFLALELGLSTSIVTGELRKLEESGEVIKRGLGWELA
jgi:DNA-binding MarR family transcriptional regulator